MSRLLLAPMEGLADCVLRDVLTRVGGYDGAVTEFVRISGTLLPTKTYRRICPELDHGSRTFAGTPVVVQLLGSDPQCMAENAARLAELAPAGIDLNFGCPAPTVNRHGGGAMLLDDPEHIGRIACAVREAVPAGIPISAKMRLGVSGTGRALECARALEAGGVSSLVVHARTKVEGYRPPAHWEWIARIRAAVSVAVVANGEVWTADDYRLCRAASTCADVMLGRGAVADPFLARRIRAIAPGDEALVPGSAAAAAASAAEWLEVLPLLAEFWAQVQARVEARHAPGRLKLWLASLRGRFVQAEALYWAVRPLRGCEETSRALELHGVPVIAELLPA